MFQLSDVVGIECDTLGMQRALMNVEFLMSRSEQKDTIYQHYYKRLRASYIHSAPDGWHDAGWWVF